MNEFRCPHCFKEIERSLISKFFASIGGSKSKRKLTPEQAREMVNKRWKNKKKKEGESK